MINNGFKRKNIHQEYLLARKKAKKSNTTTAPESDNVDWAHVYNNNNLESITNTCSIANVCKMQHLRYAAHVTRLDNNSFQKQLLFSTDHRKCSRDRWIKMEKDLNISTMQIQKMMQNKKEFMSLLYQTFTQGHSKSAKCSREYL